MASGTAMYPDQLYPASSFFGATELQPEGAKADNPASPQDKTHTVLIIVVLVVIGIALWHYNYKR